jgi:hypothetical protein
MDDALGRDLERRSVNNKYRFVLGTTRDALVDQRN